MEKAFAKRAAAEGTSAINRGLGSFPNKPLLAEWIARSIACQFYSIVIQYHQNRLHHGESQVVV